MAIEKQKKGGKDKMEIEQTESGSYVKVNYKRSSSKDAGTGYDIDVKCITGATKEEMEEIGTLALKTAKAIRERI